MSYASLLNYVREVAESLDDNVLFVTGRKEVIHELREAPPENLGIVFWCLPFISSGTFTNIGQQFNENVTINCLIYKQDYQGSEINQDTPENTSDEIDVLYQTKSIADDFIRKFNFNSISESSIEYSESLEINSISFDNVIKDNDYLLTGTLISMQVGIPDFGECQLSSLIVTGDEQVAIPNQEITPIIISADQAATFSSIDLPMGLVLETVNNTTAKITGIAPIEDVTFNVIAKGVNVELKKPITLKVFWFNNRVPNVTETQRISLNKFYNSISDTIWPKMDEVYFFGLNEEDYLTGLIQKTAEDTNTIKLSEGLRFDGVGGSDSFFNSKINPAIDNGNFQQDDAEVNVFVFDINNANDNNGQRPRMFAGGSSVITRLESQESLNRVTVVLNSGGEVIAAPSLVEDLTLASLSRKDTNEIQLFYNAVKISEPNDTEPTIGLTDGEILFGTNVNLNGFWTGTMSLISVGSYLEPSEKNLYYAAVKQLLIDNNIIDLSSFKTFHKETFIIEEVTDCDALDVYVDDNGKHQILACQSTGDPRAWIWSEGEDSKTWTKQLVADNIHTKIESCAWIEISGTYYPLIGDQTGDKITLHYNDGTWNSVNLVTSPNINFVKAFDIDGDGTKEIIYGHQGQGSPSSGGVYWLKFTGSDPTNPSDWTQYTIAQKPGTWGVDFIGTGSTAKIAFTTRTSSNSLNTSSTGTVNIATRTGTITDPWTINEIESVDEDYTHLTIGDFFGGSQESIAVAEYETGNINLYDHTSSYAKTVLTLPSKYDLGNRVYACFANKYGSDRSTLFIGQEDNYLIAMDYNSSTSNYDIVNEIERAPFVHPYDVPFFFTTIDGENAIIFADSEGNRIGWWKINHNE